MHKKTLQGFTLVELIVTLAVAAILMGTAVPSFTSLVNSNRLATQANDLLGAMMIARSEAIRLVKKALEDAGMDLPEPTYRVQLVQPAAHTAAATAQTQPVTSVDPRAVARDQGDVSPETELDDQIAEERARKASEDMLQAPGGKPG